MTARPHVPIFLSDGVAELFGRSIHERSTALIGIAHPEFRDELAREAQRLYHV